jgi:hypothetical protein
VTGIVAGVVLGGCVGEAREDERGDHHDESSSESLAIPDSLATPPAWASQAASLVHCDGSPLEPCPPGSTGPSCSLPCTASPAGCSFELYCHGDGSVYGLAAIGAQLYPSAPTSSAPVLVAELVEWITDHEQDLGLAPGLDDADVMLIPTEELAPPPSDRPRVVRFRQRYRSWPVLPPDDLVRVVYSPSGAVQLTGRIVDGRLEYEDADAQASARLALTSIQHHAHVRTGAPVSEIGVDGLALVAMPEAQRIAWVGHARLGGGAMLARVIVSAEADAAGPVLPLVSYRALAAEDLQDTVAIQVLTADSTTDPAAFGKSVETTLPSGAPLLGSIDDVSGQVQLATEAVVVLDLQGGSYRQLNTVASRILDPAGDFLDMASAVFLGQMAHHLFHGWYAQIDGYLTNSATGTKQWDSAVPIYLPGAQSPAPAGTFAPRMLALVNVAADDCPPTAVACATYAGYGPTSDQALAFPEVAHQPPGAAPNTEVTGLILLPPADEDGGHVDTLAHEFGHVVDLFAGSGMTKHIAPQCGGVANPCTFECLEDTSDEAPPLGESIAQMFGLVFLKHSFEPVDFEYCNIVGLFSRNNVKAFDPGPCIPEGEDISLLARPESCAKPAEYCDKPSEPGFRLECCDPAVDADCDVHAPADCGTGFQRQVPTGLCHTSPGYNTHSVLQAFWQMLNGQRCEATASFSCETTEWVPGAAPEDLVVPALLYSLRLDPLSYEQLFDGMAAHLACVHGPAVYEEFNAIACAHGLRDCTDPPPMTCETCPNGVREGGETCDGLDWVVAACSDWGNYVGGELGCNVATCQLDLSLCIGPDDGLDSTAGTSHDAGSETMAGENVTETEGGALDETEHSGCGCRAEPSNAPPWTIAFLMAPWVRRRRSSR